MNTPVDDYIKTRQLDAEARQIAQFEREQEKHRVVNIAFSSRWRKPRCACGAIGKRAGFTKNKRQKWQCTKCKKYIRIGWREGIVKGFKRGMNTPDLKVQIIIHILAEGIGIRGAARVAGVTKNTVSKLHKLIGHACGEFLNTRIANIAASEVEVDEVWTYVFKKDFNKKACEKKNHQIGSTWIYVGIDRTTKLLIAYHVGKRTTEDACQFMRKLRAKTTGEMTVYTDGFQPYPTAVYAAFLYDNELSALPDFIEHPAVIVRNNGQVGQLHATEAIDYTRACTNGIERFNATLRSGLKRLSRRTYAFSKTQQGLEDGLAIFLAYYNFCKVHGSLSGRTPAMVAGLTDHVWTIRELIVESQKTETIDMTTGEVIQVWQKPEVQQMALTA